MKVFIYKNWTLGAWDTTCLCVSFRFPNEELLQNPNYHVLEFETIEDAKSEYRFLLKGSDSVRNLFRHNYAKKVMSILNEYEEHNIKGK